MCKIVSVHKLMWQYIIESIESQKSFDFIFYIYIYKLLKNVIKLKLFIYYYMRLKIIYAGV